MAKGTKVTKEETKVQRNYATPALEKGLDVLELLASDPDGLTKSEIARRLGRTVSEIFRMLLCLERRGYILLTKDDRFRLSTRMFQMSHQYPPTDRLLTEALPVMYTLAYATSQTCHLAILESGMVSILAHSRPGTTNGWYVQPGSVVDLMESGSGHVMLAFLGEIERDHAIDAWKRITGKKPPKELNGHLQRIRKQGYEQRASYHVRGITDIAAPILDRRGNAVAALSIPFLQRLTGPSDMAGTIKKLLASAAEISVLVGATAEND